MSALSTIWTIIENIERSGDNSTLITLADIGTSVGLTQDRIVITGVGSSEGELYEGLAFDAGWVNDNTVAIDWSEFGYTSPPDDWTMGGMVKLYEEPDVDCKSMKLSFNHPTIASITSTGDEGETPIENVLNSNRGRVHTLDANDHELLATMETVSLVETVALLDIKCSIGTKIRIRGEGIVSPIDVVYPALSPRYTALERPKLGYPEVTMGGHNLRDLVPHFISYVPPMMPSTVRINILGSTDPIEFSELILCPNYTPTAAGNFNFGSQVSKTVSGTLTNRGDIIQRDYDGVSGSVQFRLAFMDTYDRTNIDLLIKSKRTILVDLYPDEYSMRWEALTAGFIVSTLPVQHNPEGSAVDVTVTSTKLHEGI